MAKIRIGTRGSKLALWQARWVEAQLTGQGHDVELIEISTTGDVTSQSLKQVGGQGVFTKEIQRALLRQEVDVAVHSLKDLPTQEIPELILGAVPERETTADCLISANNSSFEQLAAGARIGTGSLRRASQLLAWRNDVEIKDIRGNVDSRLAKLANGEFDAVILAHAGLKRLELEGHISEVLPQERILPAIGQGALGLETRKDAAEIIEALHPLDHVQSHQAVVAERTLLAKLLAGCLAPVAALATVEDGQLTLKAKVLSRDGAEAITANVEGQAVDAAEIGAKAANQLLELGAENLIAIARADQNS